MIVNGLLEVYKEFPWVYVDEERLQYYLVDEVNEVQRNSHEYIDKYWSALDDKENDTFCLRNRHMGYINPAHICSVEDDSLFDGEVTEYTYCIITMANGKAYYLPDWWCSIDLNASGQNLEEDELK